jgi:rRNA maturation RNase YbeY
MTAPHKKKRRVEVTIQNRQRKYSLDKNKIHDWAVAVLTFQGQKDVELGLVFVNDRVIRRYNRQYRGKDAATDVLSFSMMEGAVVSGRPLLGDIMISLERADKEAHLFERELAGQVLFLLIHGILHLLGYDHERSRNDEIKMQRQEKRLLQYLGGV